MSQDPNSSKAEAGTPKSSTDKPLEQLLKATDTLRKDLEKTVGQLRALHQETRELLGETQQRNQNAPGQRSKDYYKRTPAHETRHDRGYRAGPNEYEGFRGFSRGFPFVSQRHTFPGGFRGVRFSMFPPWMPSVDHPMSHRRTHPSQHRAPRNASEGRHVPRPTGQQARQPQESKTNRQSRKKHGGAEDSTP